MIDIVSALFYHHGFAQQEITNGYFYTRESIEDYWVVIKEDVNTLLGKQSDYFEKCKKLCLEPNLDKNLSMLVLWETDGKVEREEFKRNKMSLEEDPYYFKKYVIGYAKNELADLKQKIGKDDAVTFIENNIISKEMFDKYKEEPFVKEWYSLMYRIAIKIPFLNINIEKSQGLQSLFNQNDEALKKDNILEFNNIIFAKLKDLSQAKIKEISADSLFEELAFKLKESKNGN